MTQPNLEYIKARVREALDEDNANADVTVAFLGVGGSPVRAQVVAGGDAVVAGIGVAEQVFLAAGAGLAVTLDVADGDRVCDGSVMMRIDGDAGAVLGGERVALNFLQRLTGIATLTSRFVESVRGTGVTILDTRKTTPLWRDLEKYAVRCGGAENHRRSLDDMILVKENHIRALGGRAALLEFLGSAKRPAAPFVEVEVDSMSFLVEILGVPVDRVMLDNFSPEEVQTALAEIEAWRGEKREGPFELEVSGGINLDNVAAYALEGVDYISVGALTHSAPAVSMSLVVV